MANESAEYVYVHVSIMRITTHCTASSFSAQAPYD